MMKKLENDMKLFAELRKQYKEANPGPSDDDWLDDEQWYCENLATWTDIDIPDEVFYNPLRLISFLETHEIELEKSLSNSCPTSKNKQKNIIQQNNTQKK